MTYLLTHTVALIALAWVLWLPGYALAENWLGRRELGALRPLARLCLGLVTWLVGLFLLTATGLLHRSVIVVAAGAAVTAALWTWRQQTGGQKRRWRPPTRLTVMVGGAMAAVLTPLYLMAISPVVSWDAAVYHLTVPKLWLEDGGFRPIPFNVYSNWPLNVELIFAMAMAIWDYVLAKLVHFGFGLATLWAIYRGAGGGKRGRMVGWIAMALFLANPVVVFEFKVAYVDLAHAFFMISGFLFMSRAATGRALEREEETLKALFLAGLCAGAMAGLKLNGFVGAAILGTLFVPRLVAARREGELTIALKSFGLRFVLPVFVLWMPWLIKSAVTTGNPIYPLIFGGPYWSPALGEELSAWHRSMGMGREPLDYLLLVPRVILGGGEGYGRFDGVLGAFWIILLPLALLFAHQRAVVRRALWVAGLYFAAWAASSQQTRLLIPVLPLLALASATSVVALGDKLSPSWRGGFRRLAVLAAMALMVWYGTDASPGISRGRYLGAAGKSLNRYLENHGDLLPTAVHPIYQFIDQELPDDARLLLLNTAQGFFIERDYIADSFFEASQIADWLRGAASVEDLRGLLAEERVSHLLVEHRDWGIAYPPALLEMLRDPSQIEIVYRSPEGRFSLVELRPLSMG